MSSFKPLLWTTYYVLGGVFMSALYAADTSRWPLLIFTGLAVVGIAVEWLVWRLPSHPTEGNDE
jgi:hypothetical protein